MLYFTIYTAPCLVFFNFFILCYIIPFIESLFKKAAAPDFSKAAAFLKYFVKFAYEFLFVLVHFFSVFISFQHFDGVNLKRINLHRIFIKDNKVRPLTAL